MHPGQCGAISCAPGEHRERASAGLGQTASAGACGGKGRLKQHLGNQVYSFASLTAPGAAPLAQRAVALRIQGP